MIAQGSMIYDLIFEQAAVGMSCRALDGHFLEVNARYCQIVGYTRDELLEMPCCQIIYPGEEYEACQRFLKQLLLDDTPPLNPIERRGRRKDGTGFWVKTTTTLLRFPSGEPYLFLSLAEDITLEKQRAEEQLRILAEEHSARARAAESDNQLKAIFSSMTEYVVAYDVTGKLLHANDAARHILRLQDKTRTYSLWEATLQYDVRDEKDEPLSLENTPMMRILYGECLSNAQSEDIIIHQADGPTVQLSVSGAPFVNEQGVTIGGVCVFRDVTKRRLREKHILHALEALSTLVEALVQLPESSGDEPPISMVGEQIAELIAQILECRYVSIVSIDQQTELMEIVGGKGLQPKQVQSMREQVSHARLADYLEPGALELLHHNEAVVYDFEHPPFLAGSLFDMPHLLIAPMFLGPQLVGIFAIGKENAAPNYTSEDFLLVRAVAKLTALVVERINLLRQWAQAQANELALQEANRHFDAFLSIAGHELRTPLTTIKGNLQLASRRLENLKRQGGEEGLVSKLDRLQVPLDCAVQRANVQDQMIGDLLDASRMHANQLVCHLRLIDLLGLVCGTVEETRLAHPERIIQFNLPEQAYLPVMADAERIKQTMRNYLNNALNHSSNEQPIVVCIRCMGNKVCVGVKDEGLSLSLEEQKYIWEPFVSSKDIEVRYHSSSEDLGIGLYICNKIIEHHHGDVGVCSEPGAGPTFWFSLPFADSANLLPIHETCNNYTAPKI